MTALKQTSGALVHKKARKKHPGLKGRVLELVDLISHRAGAVVSREILRGKSGGVTLFAFDRGQGLSEHTAPFDAMVMVLQGTALITISGHRCRVRKGETIIMPANKPHALKALGRFKMMLTMIKK